MRGGAAAGRGEGGEGGGEGNGGGDEGRRACAAARCNGRVPAGFEKPSAIQQRAIKQIIKGRDVIAQYVGGGAGCGAGLDGSSGKPEPSPHLCSQVTVGNGENSDVLHLCAAVPGHTGSPRAENVCCLYVRVVKH